MKQTVYTTLIIIALIILSGVFYAVHTALLSLNQKKIKLLSENGDQPSEILNDYMKDITHNISALIAGEVTSFFAAGILSAGAYMEPLSAYLAARHPELILWADIIAGAVVVLCLAFLFLMGGKFIPQRVGLKNKESVALSTMGFVKFSRVLFTPLVSLSTAIANSVVRLFGINPAELNAGVTEEEIRLLVDAGEETGTIDENEKEMINNIFEFDNISVEDIATHRRDIVAVPLNATFEDIKSIFMEEKFSRIPVYNENIDDIVGIVHIKDLAKQILCDPAGIEEKGVDLKSIMMIPYFVPISKKTDELFEEMQKRKVHMAVIIDEYGGTMGIVTMEDLLEEIVGDIADEYDTEEKDIEIIGPDAYLIRGTVYLDELEDLLDIPLENEDYDTLSGLLIGQLGRIPDEGELPELEIGDYVFAVEKIEEKRIELVRITKKAAEPTEEQENQ